MKKIISESNKKNISNNSLITDTFLKELDLEVEHLFNTLDQISNKIIKFETILRERKAHFPFQLKIKEDPVLQQPIEDCHKATYPLVVGYHTQTYWYLSWESAEDNHANYRLFLIAEEKGIVSYNVDSDRVYCDEFKSVRTYKKALIETDLSTRLRYSEFLNPFIVAFKEYLKTCRISIESGDIPF